ncbi:MAG: FimV/HubP family polar landmark protein, partial [Arenimonas sp.]
MNIRYLKLSVAMGLALGSSQVMALGLGQLQVKSGLNQPLVAEIPIFAAMPGELDNLDIRLAPPEAFERVGLQRPNYLTANLSFSVGRNARGQNVVLVTSSGKFVEPFLSFLIQANWGKGSVTKEYTALIDPPYIAKAIVRPMEAPKVTVAPTQYIPPPEPTLPPIVLKPEPEPGPLPPPAEVIVEQAPPPAPLVFEQAPAPEPVEAVQAPPAAEIPAEPEPMAAAQPAPVYSPPAPVQQSNPVQTGAYGPVSQGKTLWSIAEEVRPDASVSIKQMMVALLRANPEAFEGENVNKLKRGSVLRIPSHDEASILTSEQAAALVAEQSVSLRSQRKPVPQPTETVAEAAPVSVTEPVLPAPKVAKTKPKPVVPKATVASKPKARLEIVPPSGKSTSGKAVQSGASSAAGGAELRAELTQAHEDIAARDSEISELKSRVTDLESQQTDAQKLIALKDSELKRLQDEMNKQPAAVPAPVEQTAPTTPKGTTPATVEPTVTAEPWYMNPLFLYIAGGVLLLGGLLWFLRRNKKKSDQELPVVSRRISDDADLQASLSSMQGTKNNRNEITAQNKAVKVEQAAKEVAKAAPALAKEEPELVALRNTVLSKPQ